MNVKNYLNLIIIALSIFFSFSVLAYDKPKNQNNEFIVPIDLEVFPQNFKFIINSNYQKISQKYRYSGNAKKFKEIVIKPWFFEKNIINVDKYNQNLKSFTQCYGENYELYNGSEINFRNIENYKLINKPAIITKSVNLRIVPTNLPCFHANKIGGYYPFDNYQNSNLYIGSPIFVIAATEDKKWFLVKSHENSNGWVKSENIGFMNNYDINMFKKYKLAVILKDNVFIKKRDISLKIGVFLPMIRSSKDFIELLLPISNSMNKISWNRIRLKKTEVNMMPISFEKDNIVKIGNELIKKSYGWGGIDENRDCSATTKDFFEVFGFYLPRNSRAQLEYLNKEKVFDISKMKNIEKLNFIKKNGIPFKTLIYFPGHVMLYVGMHNNQVIVFHNIWGIRIENENGEGRNIIGKSVVSSLELGKELKNITQTLLTKVTKIGVVG
jgi:hypothetical protein